MSACDWATDISIWEDVREHRAANEKAKDMDHARTVIRLGRRIKLLEDELAQKERLCLELAARLALARSAK